MTSPAPPAAPPTGWGSVKVLPTGPVTVVSEGPAGEEPPWWRAAPATVADCLTRLDEPRPRDRDRGDTAIASGGTLPAPAGGPPDHPPVHLAARDFCDAAADVYTARAARMRTRLRPSASLELEPTRLLLEYARASGWTAPAYAYASPGDLGDAVRGAVAALAAGESRSTLIVHTSCDARRLRVSAVRLTRTDGAGRRLDELARLAEREHFSLADLADLTQRADPARPRPVVKGSNVDRA